jgi:hypothetical protein
MSSSRAGFASAAFPCPMPHCRTSAAVKGLKVEIFAREARREGKNTTRPLTALGVTACYLAPAGKGATDGA